MFGESFHFVDQNKNTAKVAETLSEICLSGQPCKLGSPLFECIKLQWLSYTKNSLASIIL